MFEKPLRAAMHVKHLHIYSEILRSLTWISEAENKHKCWNPWYVHSVFFLISKNEEVILIITPFTFFALACFLLNTFILEAKKASLVYVDPRSQLGPYLI